MPIAPTHPVPAHARTHPQQNALEQLGQAHCKAFLGGRGAHNTLLFVFCCKDSISCLPQYSGIHLHLRIFVSVILSLHYIPKGVRNISGTSYIISGTSYSYTSSVRIHIYVSSYYYTMMLHHHLNAQQIGRTRKLIARADYQRFQQSCCLQRIVTSAAAGT